ncbi:MAG: hypothetical protein AB8G95_02615 [Anaerolineae bacterium]
MSRIESTWAAGTVLRLNMITEVNEAYAERLNVKTTPTFILFNAAGFEQDRWLLETPLLEDLPKE